MDYTISELQNMGGLIASLQNSIWQVDQQIQVLKDEEEKLLSDKHDLNDQLNSLPQNYEELLAQVEKYPEHDKKVIEARVSEKISKIQNLANRFSKGEITVEQFHQEENLI